MKITNDLFKFYESHGKDACLKLCEEVGISYSYFRNMKNMHFRPSSKLAQKLCSAKAAKKQMTLSGLIYPAEKYSRYKYTKE